MSMADVLKQQKNFDPSKGKPESGSQNIPAGVYDVMLNSVQHGVWRNSNSDFVRFEFKVLDGKYAGRNEFINPTLAEKTAKGTPMPDFVLAQSTSLIKVIAAMCGLDPSGLNEIFLKGDETQEYEDIQNFFSKSQGKTMKMKITERPNKKNPDYPYRSYEFKLTQQPKKEAKPADPFKNNEGSTADVSDDQLPF